MSGNDENKILDDHTKSHAIVLLRRLMLLAIDVLSFGAAVVIHKGLDLLAKWALPETWGDLSSIVSVAFNAGFVLIYCRLVYDMVLLFIPALRAKPKPAVETAG